ncbi:MAG: hypothetical protein K9J17_09690 [Flavobacteriales bacterium]|nr:hypothetical protein [Flavobacteriales bacterium]
MQQLKHKFCESIPENLTQGVVYVSVTYGTAIHLCCCGCGSEVVTPITPTDWKLSFDGETISLSPSIGNWSLPCQSHYWIKDNQVEWSGQWSRKRVDASNRIDRVAKEEYYRKDVPKEEPMETEEEIPEETTLPFWKRWFNW